MIEVACTCGKTYKIPEAQLGKKGKCSLCGREFKLTESGRWKTNSGRQVNVRKKKSALREILSRAKKTAKPRATPGVVAGNTREEQAAHSGRQPFGALSAKPDSGPKLSNREKWAGWNSGADFRTVPHVAGWKMWVLQVSWSFVLLGPVCLVGSGSGAELFGPPLLFLGLLGVIVGKVLTTLWTPGRRWMRNSIIVAGVLVAVGIYENASRTRQRQRTLEEETARLRHKFDPEVQREADQMVKRARESDEWSISSQQVFEDFERRQKEEDIRVQREALDKLRQESDAIIQKHNEETLQGINEISRQINRPTSASGFVARGLSEYAKGNYREAISDFTDALKLEPTHVGAYLNRGASYAASGDHEKAASDYDKAIVLDPENAIAHNERGNSWLAQKRLHEALVDFSRAIELDPGLSYAYMNRGVVFRQLGKLDEAIADQTRAIELDPQSSKAYQNRAIAYFQQENYRAALGDISNAIELRPAEWKLLLFRSAAKSALGDMAGARSDMNEAIRLGAPDDIVRKHRAMSGL